MTSEVNVLSDFFPSKSDLIDNIITYTPRFATLEHAPRDKFPYSQDDILIRMPAINAALDPVSYAQAIRNISNETDFTRSMGLDHELLSKTDLDQLFVMDPLTPLSVHYITDGRQTGKRVHDK